MDDSNHIANQVKHVFQSISSPPHQLQSQVPSQPQPKPKPKLKTQPKPQQRPKNKRH